MMQTGKKYLFEKTISKCRETKRETVTQLFPEWWLDQNLNVLYKL